MLKLIENCYFHLQYNKRKQKEELGRYFNKVMRIRDKNFASQSYLVAACSKFWYR